jgi:glucose/arabinose dehydrogenase
MAWAADGTLLVATGDGFDYREQAQRLDNHLGKILRIAADGSVPPDNPFVGRSDALAEIYSYGHRNVQGLVVDEAGVVWAHEHGPRGGDELNRVKAGGNYGWPLVTHGVDYSGAQVSPFRTLPDMIDPLHVWTPSIAPAGLMRYGGSEFADWRGDFFVAALAGKQLQRLRLKADGSVGVEAVMFDAPGERLRDVREGPDGGIYLLTDSAEGRVLRVVGE